MQSVILAGGKGTRLRPLTLHTPKPIMPLVGLPFLAYQINLLRNAAIQDVVLSLSYQPHKIEDVFGDGSHHGMRIRYVVESQPLGTAGAYKNARDVIDSRTVVFNGDILTDIDLTEVLSVHKERGAAVTIVLTPVENPRAYGLVETEADGRVRRFLEKPKGDEITTNTINAGIYVIEPEILKHIPADEVFSFEYDLFPSLLAKGVPVFGYVSERYWIDIGTPRRYLTANLDLLAGRVPAAPFVPRSRGERVDEKAVVDDLSWVDPSATIKAGAQIVNSVVEANCVVDEKAVVENSVLRRSTRVGQSATVRESIAGMSCHIGRFAAVERVALGDKSVLTDYTAAGVLA
jgi:NDP-sugar pyrophosphorylase family protein